MRKSITIVITHQESPGGQDYKVLGRVTELSDIVLHALRDLILAEFDAFSGDPSRVMGVDDAETLEAPAASAKAV